MANTLEKYLLPSNGKISGIPKEVTLRNMTTAEEKMLIGSTEDVFDDIISQCVVEPKNFNIGDLVLIDKNYLYVKLRIVSYGNIYKFSYRCPICGEVSEFSVDLDTLPVEYLSDDFKEPFAEFELPKSGDTIALRIPRIKEYTDNRMKVRRYNKKFPGAKGDQGWIYGMMSFIASINGKEPDAKLQQYVEDLHAMDAAYIRHQIAKVDAGIDTTLQEICPKCKEEIEILIPTGPTFFRATFDD